MPIAIVVHGGAGDIAPERRAITEEGCKEAALVGWRILQAGGPALAAVEAAVRALEDNPEFNAGTGACLNIDGNIQLDAGIMDGVNLQVGAIAGVERIKNPIALARSVLESPHVLLVGDGAVEFARERGISQCTLEELITERQYASWQQEMGRREAEEPRIHRREVRSVKARTDEHGTVGAVAIDVSGALAAATSTGGIRNKYPGRVGDSPLVGCGFYADEFAAVSCTGHGEDFVRLLIAKRAADAVANGLNAHEAAQASIAFLGARASGTGGLIVVDHHGRAGYAWNSKTMSYAYLTDH
jgi:L-asparaginase / beta-aspartyl-peptidase